jgi:pimeloyl-ACP methyl ester carboxylesterase
MTPPLRPNERIVHANGVDICIETFGDPADPAILLIGGAAASMDWWEDVFCERLAAGPRFVIRYDNRDTGRSVAYAPGEPGYDGLDLVADAIGLLDTLGLARAHLVGISMGGGIAQRAALDHPDRVATLTLFSTTAIGPDRPGSPDLPPMSDELRASFADPPPDPDWSDRAAVIDYMVDGMHPFAGPRTYADAHLRELAGRIFDRTANLASSMTNHWVLDEGEPVRRPVSDVAAPTLVMHGSADPLFPYGHGVALADQIPGARLIALDQIGHELPPPAWDVAAAEILRHTTRD